MEETIPPEQPGNLQDYDRAYREFNWASMEREFDWSHGGVYNVVSEALDRHCRNGRRDKVALISILADNSVNTITFGQMSELTSKFGDGLLKLGAAKGDRIFVFLDRSPELFVSILGIAKMGGIAGPLFSALGPEAVRDRILDSQAKIVITSPYLFHRIIPILRDISVVEKFIIVGKDGVDNEKAIPYEEVLASGDASFQAVAMEPEDPYIIHYTSGSTGKPKGVLLGHKAMMQQAMSCRYVVDLRDDDIYWCTADPGWVTGTSVGIFGPWYLGNTIISYQGRFDAAMWYSIMERFKVTVWFTAPTALRMLKKSGDEVVSGYDISSVRHICSAGEPLNPEVIRWGMKVLGRRIHDNWWQTETGAPCISNFKCMKIKLGSMGRPLPGVVVAIVDEHGKPLPPRKEGFLALRPGWPAMMVGIYGSKQRYRDYFHVPGWYISGDQAYMDEEGYIWFLGRADDVIKTSGERLGPFEVESALIEHPAVAESAVIGKPDELRGAIVKAFIVLKPGVAPSDKLKEEITQFVRTQLAYYAYPREIEFVASLPKTRSGKIMRRVLKAKEMGQPLGDLSTLED
ncbi:MAG: Acetyl-coenzyme A synthetase [Methanomassiliicoccales archaeon PtaU1.Bin124]|nr:MAG: Acetyl-coenzyme A synthetase [Methanomassiliicoccales archaeon PtaU1.Bin124]